MVHDGSREKKLINIIIIAENLMQSITISYCIHQRQHGCWISIAILRHTLLLQVYINSCLSFNYGKFTIDTMC